MFRGVTSINLDAKGRLAIPTKYRDELKESCDYQLVITADKDGCLLLFPLPEWEMVEQKLNKLPSLNKHVRSLQRLMIGHANECEMDSQGRILLSEKLRQFAGLQKRVALVGQLKKIEIWDELTWDKRLDDSINDGGLDELAGLVGLEHSSPELGSFSY